MDNHADTNKMTAAVNTVGYLTLAVAAIVLGFSFCAHSKYGFTSENSHGGLWQFCNTTGNDTKNCKDVDG